MRSPCCLCVCALSPSISECLYETFYVYHDTWGHIISVLHKYLLPVCVCVCVFSYVNLFTFGKELLCKNVTAATNSNITIEELLEASL
jgi:hypothetical protein